MKKFAFLLAAALLLNGCQPSTPANASSGPASSEPEVSSSQAASAAEDASSAEEPQSASSSIAADAPKPEAPPQTTPGAIDLPDQVAASSAGYEVKLLTPAQYDSSIEPQRGGYRGFLNMDYFLLGEGGKYAVANANGKIVTDFAYDHNDAWFAQEGVISISKDGKYGILDAKDGSQLLPFAYDSVYPLVRSQLLVAQDGDDVQVFDRAGNVIFELERGDQIYAMGDYLVIHQDGMLKFYRKDTYEPVDNFSCEEFKLVKYETEFLIAYMTTGAWGLCAEDGTILREPSFDEIGYFVGDYAPFTQNGKKGVLNYKGEVVLKAEWDDLVVYERSISVCRGDKWGAIIDVESKKLAIEPMYDYICGFSADGKASYERKNLYGIIDKEGNELIPAKYDYRVYSENANLEDGYYLVEGDGPGLAGVIGGGKVVLSNDHVFYAKGINPVYAEDEPYNLVATPREQWGYVDRTGKFVIDAKFEQADGFIKGYNVAFVKKDGKICLIDRKGQTVLETVFDDLVAYHAESMVGVFRYTNADGVTKCCLAQITGLAASV